MNNESTDQPRLQKIIVGFPEGKVYGYANRDTQGKLEDIDGTSDSEPLIHIYRNGSTEEEQLSIKEAQAIYLVSSFEKRSSKEDIYFHDGYDPPPVLWVRITLNSGDYFEGMLRNDHSYLCGYGFYVQPTDPSTNISLIFVLRKNIVSFEVLGLRSDWLENK